MPFSFVVHKLKYTGFRGSCGKKFILHADTSIKQVAIIINE